MTETLQPMADEVDPQQLAERLLRVHQRHGSTLLPYVVDGRRLVLGLEADAGIAPARADPADVATAVGHQPVGFTVSEIPIPGKRRAIGRLVLESVREHGPPITFDPILNALPRLHPPAPAGVGTPSRPRWAADPRTPQAKPAEGDNGPMRGPARRRGRPAARVRRTGAASITGQCTPTSLGPGP